MPVFTFKSQYFLISVYGDIFGCQILLRHTGKAGGKKIRQNLGSNFDHAGGDLPHLAYGNGKLKPYKTASDDNGMRNAFAV